MDAAAVLCCIMPSVLPHTACAEHYEIVSDVMWSRMLTATAHEQSEAQQQPQ
jgi:hypothetical protein